MVNHFRDPGILVNCFVGIPGIFSSHLVVLLLLEEASDAENCASRCHSYSNTPTGVTS